MGQYHKIKCPTCGTSIETEVMLEMCPVCKVYIGDKFQQQGGGTGIEAPTPDTDAPQVSN